MSKSAGVAIADMMVRGCLIVVRWWLAAGVTAWSRVGQSGGRGGGRTAGQGMQLDDFWGGLRADAEGY